jgi:hypothetical protein
MVAIRLAALVTRKQALVQMPTISLKDDAPSQNPEKLGDDRLKGYFSVARHFFVKSGFDAAVRLSPTAL